MHAPRTIGLGRLLRAACILAPLAIVACAQGQGVALLEALEGYNDSVRWGRTAAAAAYLTPAERAGFLSRSEQLRDLQVTGCQLDGVRLQGPNRAYVRVRFDWYSMDQGRLFQTVMLQTWVKAGESWRVKDQRWVRGATFPLFASAAPLPRR